MGANALKIVQKFFPGVTSVVDARTPARVEVTPKDANPKGVKSHETCALAVACKRKFHLDGVIISRSTAYLVKGKKARRFKLPPSVSREVVSFDRGSEFASGSYQLSAVAESNRLGVRTGSGRDKGTGTGAAKKFRHLTANVRTVLGGEQPEN